MLPNCTTSSSSTYAPSAPTIEVIEQHELEQAVVASYDLNNFPDVPTSEIAIARRATTGDHLIPIAEARVVPPSNNIREITQIAVALSAPTIVTSPLSMFMQPEDNSDKALTRTPSYSTDGSE